MASSSSSTGGPGPAWSLEGKAVLVTGGTKGIGAAVVRELLAHSASTVIFCSRSPLPEDGTEKADGAINLPEIQSQYPGSNIHHVQCDVATEEGRQLLFDTVSTTIGVTALHGLVNNVGVNVRKPAVEQTPDEYQSMVRTNIDSAYFISRLFVPLLAEAANGSSIVNVSSAAGVQSSGTGVAYGMTKAAMNQLTRGLACEWAGSNYRVRVNAVAPWMTWTPMLREAVKDDPAQLDQVQAWTPMHRLAEAYEIAAPIVFLLLPASSYITGQVLGVDGGLTAQGFAGPCVE